MQSVSSHPDEGDGPSRHDEPPAPFARLLRMSERNPRHAAAAARRLCAGAAAGGPPPQLWGDYTLGLVLLRWERLDEAEPLLARAEAGWRDLGRPLLACHARRGRLVIARLRGASPALQEDYGRLAAAYEARGAQIEAARTRFEQIAHLNTMGRTREALALIEAIEGAVARLGAPADGARLARLRAVALCDLGSLELARQHFTLAVEAYQASRATLEVAKSLFERSSVWLRLQRFHEAEDDLMRSEAIFRRLGIPLWQGYCQKRRGIVCNHLGRFADAIRAAQRAHRIFLALDRMDHAAECDLNLGNTAYYTGLFRLALLAYRRAESVSKAMGWQRTALVCQRNRAMSLRALGEHSEAYDLLAQVEGAIATVGDLVEQAEVQHAQGQVLRDLGAVDLALAHLRRAEQAFTALGNARAAAESQVEQGWALLTAGQLAPAHTCFSQALAALGDRPTMRWLAQYGLARAEELSGDIAAAFGHYGAATKTIAALQQQLVNEHASSGVFANAAGLFAHALRLACELQDSVVVLTLIEQHRALTLKLQLSRPPAPSGPDAPDAQLDQLLGQLLTPEAGPGDRGDVLLERYLETVLRTLPMLPAGAEELRVDIDIEGFRRACASVFPQGWAYLSYALVETSLIIATVTAAQITWASVALDDELTGLLERACLPQYRFRAYAGLESGGPSRSPWAHVATLGGRLLPEAVVAQLHPGFRLLIAPDGLLHHLPWAALRVRGAWLAEQATVQLIPGIQHWRALIERASPGGGALLIGVNSFTARAEPLLHAEDSLDLVERYWPGPFTRLEGDAATRGQLIALSRSGRLQRYGLLHIATHGHLPTDQGVLAHLKLADADLLYYEVLQLALGGGLVVLSACDGLASEVLPGKEVLNLSRAFLAAGARDVIASLWELFDEALLGTLQALYRALAGGCDAPTAVARAQRALIALQPTLAVEDAILASPLVWASLCAIGAGGVSSPAGGTIPAEPALRSAE